MSAEWYREDLFSSVTTRVSDLASTLGDKLRADDYDINHELWSQLSRLLIDNVERYLLEKRNRARFFVSDEEFIDKSARQNTPLRKYYTREELYYVINVVYSKDRRVDERESEEEQLLESSPGPPRRRPKKSRKPPRVPFGALTNMR